ncbi:hypothetical protein AB7M63_006524 [Bradyrhizobium japonicum]
MLDLATVLAACAGIGLAFQVGHLAEHAVQFAVWILGDYSNVCGRDTPWMSSWVTEMVRQSGAIMFPAVDARRQMMMGMEVLHLIGNSIFLVSLGCLYYCVRSKWVRWALYIECFHLYEHLMLTSTAYFVGKPLGLSTLFGGSDIIGSREFAVGYRVIWHFAMNLLPMPFAMIGLIEHMRRGSGPRPLASWSLRMFKGFVSARSISTPQRHGSLRR